MTIPNHNNNNNKKKKKNSVTQVAVLKPGADINARVTGCITSNARTFAVNQALYEHLYATLVPLVPVRKHGKPSWVDARM